MQASLRLGSSEVQGVRGVQEGKWMNCGFAFAVYRPVCGALLCLRGRCGRHPGGEPLNVARNLN